MGRKRCISGEFLGDTAQQEAELAMNRRGTVAALAIAAVGVAGAVPALAAPGKTKPKPLKGTWSYTDTTPDPSGNAESSDSMHCRGKLPAGPADVNAHKLKVKRTGTLTVQSSVVGDWALELDDAKGNVVAGDDENPPASEGLAGITLKKGTYSVVLCNLEGAPTASADYTFTYR
jgi:hypothetical protein